tara:strand:+ start:368 stop:499 length:132 start_codon:yes stop_codon:yes gene_type:complete
MPSKFFGNRFDKPTHSKKGVKQKIVNKSNKAKSSGIRKVGRGN